MAPAAGPHPDSCLSESTLPKLEPPDPVSVPRKPNAANASFSSTTYTNVSFRDIGLSFAGLRGLEEDLEAALESGKDGTALTPALSKRPPWVPDHLAPQCTDCQGQFHFFYRRHHCRMCGRVFCWRCSRPRIKIPEMKYDSKVRVCYHCCESRLQKKASKWQHVLSEFDIMDMVGEGGMGKVYKVMRKKTSTVLAMKVVEKRSIRCEYSAMAVAVEKFVLSKVKHPFIIQLHESFQTNDKLFFVMDFMSRGDLFHLMHTVSIPEAVVRLFAAEIGMALNYLHECGWIYRDLKPENCLLADDGHVVLMDMGLALKTDKESSRNDTAHPLGTPEYWSPELIRGVGYTVALDYWQLGVLMCELLTRVHPFEDSERKVHVRAIEHPRRAHRLAPGDGPISAECHDLVAQLLCKNHLERLQDWTAFKGHGWFAGLNFEDVYAKKVPIPDLCQPLAAPQPPGNSQALLATSYDGPQYSAFSWRPAAGSRPASNTIFEC